MKKILPLTAPINTTWTWHANLFAIIEQFPESKEWYLTNYVQLKCDIQKTRSIDDLFMDFCPGDQAFFRCPLLQCQLLDRSYINAIYRDDILKFLLESIDTNHYLYGIFDETEMLLRHERFLHELMIFGYDTEKQVFYVSDFTFTGTYSFQQVPFDLVVSGYEKVSPQDDYLNCNNGGIYLFSKRQFGNQFSFDIGQIKESIEEYLFSYNSQKHEWAFANNIYYNVYGIQIYDRVSNLLRALYEGTGNYDIRPFHTLYIHKKLMVIRVQYLIQTGNLKNDDLLGGFERVQDSALTIRNLILKYNMTKMKSTLLKALEIINEIKKNEILLLEKLHSLI